MAFVPFCGMPAGYFQSLNASNLRSAESQLSVPQHNVHHIAVNFVTAVLSDIPVSPPLFTIALQQCF